MGEAAILPMPAKIHDKEKVKSDKANKQLLSTGPKLPVIKNDCWTQEANYMSQIT